jgi:hypothetical protein
MTRSREMLRKAASLSATLRTSDTVQVATVRVTNHTGHKLPTGYPEGRQMWLHVQALDANGQIVFESGAYDFEAGQLVRDPAIKVYEVKQGMTVELAAYLNQRPGASFHFLLNNAVIKDNRIPPQGYAPPFLTESRLGDSSTDYAPGQYWDETEYIIPQDAVRLVVTLYYQTASREYIDFLQKNGGADGLTLARLWQASKSPPEIVAQTWLPTLNLYLPLCFRGR